jgi:anti-anti-sigma regulatory factor
MDSAGFHALVNATEYAVRHHHRLVIRKLSAQCAEVLRICDWENVLHVEP